MSGKTEKIFSESKKHGWVLEPHAKELFREHGLVTTDFIWARSADQAVKWAAQTGYPLVAKVISYKVLHKSDAGGVVAGIRNEEELREAYTRLSGIDGADGVLVDRMVDGTELIVGSMNDGQFGPVVMAGIGGTSVEIYSDVVFRMAPLGPGEVGKALGSLKGIELLTGHRGSDPVNMKALVELVVNFSRLAYELKDRVESIDLNPVFCNSEKAVIADARIMLKS